MEKVYEVGSFVTHKLTGEKCMIIRKGKEQYLVRTPNYKEIWVYTYEIEDVK